MDPDDGDNIIEKFRILGISRKFHRKKLLNYLTNIDKYGMI